jgi:hypothetical protein
MKPDTRRPTIETTAPNPSAMALRVFSKNQTGSYMDGMGPIAGRSTYVDNRTAARALPVTSRAAKKAGRLPRTRT